MPIDIVLPRLNSYQIFLQNKPSYQILLKINEFEGKWQNLTYFLSLFYPSLLLLIDTFIHSTTPFTFSFLLIITDNSNATPKRAKRGIERKKRLKRKRKNYEPMDLKPKEEQKRTRF